MRATGAFSLTVCSGSVSAICAGIAPMPSRGRPVGPSASILRTVSKRRLEASRLGSSWMPANSGRQNGSIERADSPAPPRRSAVVPSGALRMSRTEDRRVPITRRAMRAFSAKPPIGADSVRTSCSGRRSGSLTR